MNMKLLTLIALCDHTAEGAAVRRPPSCSRAELSIRNERPQAAFCQVVSRPERDIQIQPFTEGGECEGGCCMVRVMPTPVATRAAYSSMPDKDPVIYGAPKLAKPGDQIVLNCSSDYSLPASDINWYINDELQKFSPGVFELRGVFSDSPCHQMLLAPSE
ncbi:unnamed protein product [Leptidea sinapis]|uniref:Ig-like domain-containing protein n=1 Tax=Leptidea sinapis TaxID=189913 RepID=A0A5E4R5N0_9NEOP|nr:unnamed protein product [Leptidea sinapis]